MWYIYTREYYSVLTKNEIMPFAAMWMHLETVILSEVSQRQIPRYCLYVASKTMMQMKLFVRQK